MKKMNFIIVISLLVIILTACASNYTNIENVENPQEEVYAYALPEWLRWGMKEGEVRQNLKGDILEYKDLIYIIHPYDENYKNCTVKEFYGFTQENALIHMNYSFHHSILNDEPNQYYELYLEAKEELTSIYGEPTGETEEWKNERYKNDEYMKYKAIEEGDYTSMVAWELEGYICYVQLNSGVDICFEAKKE